MNLYDHLTSALSQVGVALGIGCLVYSLVWIFFRCQLSGQSVFRYLGFVPAKSQLDLRFGFIWLGTISLSIALLIAEFYLSGAFRQLLMSSSSPYGKILQNGFGLVAVLKALIYCFIQASLAEEILFRGLFAKRLFNALGNFWGNIIQALVFWLMHLLIFRLITGEWISILQLVTFLTSFGLGLVFGYVNLRKHGESILPSWLLHGSVNFFSFLGLAALWPR